MAYKNGIQLNVKLTPLNNLKKELDSTIKALEKDNNLKLNINVNEINTSFKEISNIIGNLSTQLNKSFKIDTSGIDNAGNKLKNIQNLSSTSNTFKINSDGTTELVKSVDKINVGLGETITLTNDLQGKLTATSNIDYTKKQKEVDEQYKLQLKDLQELNNLELKRQQELQKSQEKVKSIQETLNSKLSNSSKNNLIDEGVLKNLQKELNAINVDTPISKIKELKTQINNLGSSDNQIVKLQNEINKMKNGLTSLKGKYGNLVGNSNSKKELEDYISEINKLKSTLNDLKSGKSLTGNQLSQQFTSAKNASKELSNSVKDNSSALKLAQKDASSFGDAIKRSLGNLGIYASTAMAIQQITKQFKDASNYVIALDKNITNIQMITGATKEQVVQTTNAFKDLGGQLHTTNTEMLNSAEELMRAGYDESTTQKMIEASTIASKISGQTNAQTSEQLIAIKNAFDMTGSEMEHVIDVISKLDNTSATSFAEISEAIMRTAYSAQQAGTPFDKLASYITVVSEKTRKSAETIGESFKTIYSRYSNIKLGNLDDEGKSINDTETAMNRIGIAIRNNKGEFREFDDVLTEFIAKYKSGAITQVDYLAGVQALGGTRQRETIMALIENVDTLNQHQQDLVGSTGSAKKMFNEAYSGSIDAKINDLKRSFEQLYETIMTSDGLKWLIEESTQLVTALANVDGQTLIFIGTMGSMIFVFSKIIKISKELKTLNLLSEMSNFQQILSVFSSVSARQGVVAGLGASFKVLSLGIKEATASAIAFCVTPLGLTITAIASVIGIATVAFTSYKKHQEDLVKQSNDLKDAINGVNEAIAGGDTSSASSQLDAVRNQQKELQNLIKQRQELLSKDSNDFNQSSGGVDKQSAIDGVNKRIQEQIDVIKKAGLTVNEYTGEINELVEKEQLIANENIVDKIENETKAQINNKSELESANQEYQNHISTIQSLYSEYQNLSAQEELSAQQKERLNGVISTLQGQFANLNIKVDENGRAYIENTPLIEDQISYLTSEGMTVDTLTGIRINDSRVMSEWMVNGTSVTYTEIQKRILNYKEEIKAIQALIQARMLEAGAEISKQAPDMTQDSINDARTESKFLKQKQMYEKQIGSAESNLKELEGIKAQADAIYGGVSTSGLSGGGGGSSVGSGGYTPSGGKGSGSKGGSGSSGQSDAEKAEEERIKNMEKLLELNEKLNNSYDRYFDYNNAYDEINNKIKEQETLIEGLNGSDKIKAEQTLLDLKKQQIQALKDLNEERKRETNEIATQLQEKGFEIDANGKLINSQKQLAKLQEDLKQKTYDISDAGVEAKENDIEALKNLEETTKNYIKLVNDEIPSCTDQYNELANAIMKTQQEQLQALYDDLAGSIKEKWEDDRDVELQKEEDLYTVRKGVLEKRFQADLESLENEKQSLIDGYDIQIKDLQDQLDALNDDTEDKAKKLVALQNEKKLWEKDDSVMSARKQQELQQQIDSLTKEIQKDNLQKQIDELNEKKDNESDYYDDKIDSLKNSHNDELDELESSHKAEAKEIEDNHKDELIEQEAYEEAKRLIISNSQDTILSYLEGNSESYKKVGSLLGENFTEGFTSQIQTAIDAYNSLADKVGVDGIGDISNNNSSKENNMATSSGNSNSKSDSNNESSSIKNGTLNGKSYTYNEDTGDIFTQGQQASFTKEEMAEIKKKIQHFRKGGIVPNTVGKDEALAYVGAGEGIVNSEQMSNLNKGMAIVNTDLKNFIDKFDSTYKLNTLGGYNLGVFGNTTDLNSMANRAMNNTTNNNSNDNSTIVQMDVNIVNNNLQDVAMNEKNIEKVFRKVIKNDGRRFK